MGSSRSCQNGISQARTIDYIPRLRYDKTENTQTAIYYQHKIKMNGARKKYSPSLHWICFNKKKSKNNKNEKLKTKIWTRELMCRIVQYLLNLNRQVLLPVRCTLPQAPTALPWCCLIYNIPIDSLTHAQPTTYHFDCLLSHILNPWMYHRISIFHYKFIFILLLVFIHLTNNSIY